MSHTPKKLTTDHRCGKLNSYSPSQERIWGIREEPGYYDAVNQMAQPEALLVYVGPSITKGPRQAEKNVLAQ